MDIIILLSLVSIILVTISIFWWFPHLLISVAVRDILYSTIYKEEYRVNDLTLDWFLCTEETNPLLTVLFSQFTKKNIKLDKDTWCSYLERGDVTSTSKSILFIHGFNESSVEFAKMGSYFDKSYHLIAIDLCNHGDSTGFTQPVSIPDFVKFVKKFCESSDLHCRKFHLIGYSLGGQISAHYASEFPEDLASLTLVDSAGIQLDLLHKGERGNIHFDTDDDLVELLDYYGNGTVPIPSKLFLTASRYYRNRNTDRIRHVFNGRQDLFMLTKKLMNDIKHLPIFVIWGQLDVICPVTCVDFLKDHLPNVKVQVFSACSHSILLSHSRETAEQLNSWLNELT